MQGDTIDSPPSRPSPVPLSTRRAVPNAPPTSPGAQSPTPGQGRNTLSGLLASRPGNPPIPPSLQAKMAAMLNRGVPNSSASFSIDSAAQALNRASLNDRLPHGSNSFPPVPSNSPFPGRGRPGAPPPAKKNKPGFKLSDIAAGGGAMGAGLGEGRPSLAEANRNVGDTPFANFNKIVDPSGRLNFSGKAVIHASGVDFSNGSSFAINMEQLKLEQELGRGNYGTVKKVLHKPTNVEMAMKEIRLELDSAKLNGILMELDILHRAISPHIVEFYGAFFVESCVYYCMEYMDGGSLASLCCDPPGANVLVGSGRFAPPPGEREGSEGQCEMTKPRLTEPLLARVAASMTRGLKFLKDELGVMHRDVKPTNVLVSAKGFIKLCDFGVSGQLEKSVARTNIGCQSYMAPERIKGASPTPNDDTFMSYSVSADIWSLGLSIVELSRGRYPYPPETYENVFAQLSAIVDGEAPGLPDDEEDPPPVNGAAKSEDDDNDDEDDFKDAEEEVTLDSGEAAEGPGQSEAPAWGSETARKWSPEARDWVKRCLIKNASERASYAELLEHPWLKADAERTVDMASWVKRALVWRETHHRGASWGGE